MGDCVGDFLFAVTGGLDRGLDVANLFECKTVLIVVVFYFHVSSLIRCWGRRGEGLPMKLSSNSPTSKMRTPSLSVTSETSSSHSSPHTESCLATSFRSQETCHINEYHMLQPKDRSKSTSSMLLMRDFSILMSWVNRFANSGANAPAVPLRKVNPRDPPPKNRPLLVDD